MSVASSHTLSTCDGEFPDAYIIPLELLEKIIGSAIGGHIHDWLSPVVTSISAPINTFGPELFVSLWRPISSLMAVSFTFRATVIRLVCLAFGVRPLETKSLSRQVYEKLRSFFYFSRAIYCGALMDPPPALCSPLLRGYCSFIVLEHQPLRGIAKSLSIRCQENLTYLESSGDLPGELTECLLDNIR